MRYASYGALRMIEPRMRLTPFEAAMFGLASAAGDFENTKPCGSMIVPFALTRIPKRSLRASNCSSVSGAKRFFWSWYTTTHWLPSHATRGQY
jgi:hypothetical protein